MMQFHVTHEDRSTVTGKRQRLIATLESRGNPANHSFHRQEVCSSTSSSQPRPVRQRSCSMILATRLTGANIPRGSKHRARYRQNTSASERFYGERPNKLCYLLSDIASVHKYQIRLASLHLPRRNKSLSSLSLKYNVPKISTDVQKIRNHF